MDYDRNSNTWPKLRRKRYFSNKEIENTVKSLFTTILGRAYVNILNILENSEIYDIYHAYLVGFALNLA